MPRAVLSDAEKEAAVAAASADLKFLLQRQGVVGDNQLLFYHHGIVSMEKFANLAKDRDDMIKVIKDQWAIDPDNS